MSHANSSYTENNLENYYLLSFLGSILGEAKDCGSDYIGFEDVDAPDKSGIWPVIVNKENVSILDEYSELTEDKMYKIIGYCTFHNIEFIINGQCDNQDLWRTFCEMRKAAKL
jgi:hypothetical protein